MSGATNAEEAEEGQPQVRVHDSPSGILPGGVRGTEAETGAGVHRGGAAGGGRLHEGERHPAAGVYAIVCVRTGHTYIGATTNLSQRRRYHWNYIRRGSHIEKTMGALCREYGSASMEWRVLEEVSGENLDELLQSAETRWMFSTRREIGDPPVLRLTKLLMVEQAEQWQAKCITKHIPTLVGG